MNATIKKTNLTAEQIELNNEKKELAKLAKIIEKTPSKKELKEVAKNEYIVEINNLDFNLSSDTMNLINRNIELSEQLKQLRKEQLSNAKYIFLNVNSELSALKIAIDNDKNLKHIEFTKKGIINLLRLKLNSTKLEKDLLNSIDIALNYMTYNLSLNLEFVTINEIKTIIKAYELSINGVNEYKSITKNRIAKAKNEATVKDLLNEIKEAKAKAKANTETKAKAENEAKIIADYLAKQNEKVA